ncbi:hypothetical protein KAX02_13195, partial [candidate division WOR-3 bacterium]|nr:hypothetical protein [candidate division WOR-3 bacterium]
RNKKLETGKRQNELRASKGRASIPVSTTINEIVYKYGLSLIIPCWSVTVWTIELYIFKKY